MKHLLAIAAALVISGCTTSSAIMTGQSRSIRNPAEVKVYLRPPAQFESIALVNAKSNAVPSRESNRERVIDELKKKAAELGANGLLLNPNEINQGTMMGGMFMPGPTKYSPGFMVGGGGPGFMVEMQAEAIYVTTP